MAFSGVDRLRQLDLYFLALAASAERTLIPEIYEIFGLESATKFLEIFAGRTIQVPDVDVLRKAVRDVDVYSTLLGLPKGKERNAALARVRDRHALTANEIKAIEIRMRALYARAVSGEEAKSTQQTPSKAAV